MASETFFVIINPTSGYGKARRLWPKIAQLLIDSSLAFEYVFTEHHKHSQELVIRAINKGFTRFICVGGDGTIHNIVNGIMKQTQYQTDSISLGVIPIGTGNDWVKTYDIPRAIDKAIHIIKNGRLRRQDIGEITFPDAPESSIYFNNLAGIGFDGLVVNKVHKYKHLGALAYIVGAILGLFSAKNFSCTIQTSSKTVTTEALMVLVGICKYSGGGMRLTDSPDPSDGLFDVSIAERFTTLDVLCNLPRLFNGNVKRFKKVKLLKINSLDVVADKKVSPYIQADGELIGRGGMRVSLHRNALSFYCP